MISMQGIPSVLIAKNQSWVRQQAQALARRLPANVERADLIQVGLIAVAQAAVSFEWPTDRDSPQAQEDFVRFARMRVKGAMLDELRQMDFLSRSERRKLKAVEIARERLRHLLGAEPGLLQLAQSTGLSGDEIGQLLRADQLGRQQIHTAGDERPEGPQAQQAATEKDEVEARVDTAIVLRRLERFFAELPERERLVIDAYLGIGLTPAELARSLNVTPSRVSQIYHAVVQRAATHFGQVLPHQRATDRWCKPSTPSLDELIQAREQALRGSAHGAWGELIEHVLAQPVVPPMPAPAAPPDLAPAAQPEDGVIQVGASTRWG